MLLTVTVMVASMITVIMVQSRVKPVNLSFRFLLFRAEIGINNVSHLVYFGARKCRRDFGRLFHRHHVALGVLGVGVFNPVDPVHGAVVVEPSVAIHLVQI